MAEGRGFALVSVLLLLVTLLVLGLGMQQLALFNLQLAQGSALRLAAQVETQSTLTQALLILEQLAAGGELPADAAALPGVSSYELLPGDQVALTVTSLERPGVSSEALAGLTEGGFRVQGRR
jgi:hypothetical protein